MRFWSVSKVEHGTGEVPVQSGAQVGGKLQQSVDVGRVVFNLPLHAPYWYFLPRDRAFGSLFSNASGAQYSVMATAPAPNPMRIGTPNGTVTHLDEYQAYDEARQRRLAARDAVGPAAADDRRQQQPGGVGMRISRPVRSDPHRRAVPRACVRGVGGR